MVISWRTGEGNERERRSKRGREIERYRDRRKVKKGRDRVTTFV
jgi:hypothetical protein